MVRLDAALLAWIFVGCIAATDAPPAPADGVSAATPAIDAGPPHVTPSIPATKTETAHDAGADTASWARYVITPGAHSAIVESAASGNPMAGIVNGVVQRTYDLVFDPSAMYTITQAVEPNDQFDWNKLPGLSDCGELDLAADGVMFGWRWRLDRTPEVLEVTAYANNARVHLTSPAPMIVLDAADLASRTPLRYRIAMDGAEYRFAISGVMRGRAIDASATLTRRCATTSPASLPLQWAAGLYFGGTSSAPSMITARIFEL